jgi:hypothetical protein
MKKVVFWSLVVFVFAFAVRVYWICNKKGFHFDETATHIVSTHTRYGWNRYYPKDYEMTGAYIKEITFKKCCLIVEIVV